MDRPTTRPSRPGGGGAAGDFLQNRPATRPSPPDRPGGGDRPGPGDRPGGGNRPGPGGDRPTTLPGRPGDRPGTRPPGDRPGNRPPLAGHRPGHRPPGSRPPGWRPPGQRPPGYRPPGYRPPHPGHYPGYGPGYWNRYPNWHWGWANYPNQNWWAWATAGAVTGWLVGGLNSQPIYYSYGENLYYEGDTVYYNEQPVGTAEQYAQQAQEIASNVPEVQPEDVEWLPLGVFALADTDTVSAEDATLFLQLAISKEGIIAGTFQNTATGDSFEVEGTIDRESQRAAWGPVDKDWPIMETGIYNLSENVAGALLHFEDGETQQWTLLRLDEPDSDSQN
ncbi:hypothetical protein FYK55_05440 [Roseiconus nitratireducens]|uniref:Uncharacterized protein n=1 Tax=Roseiconus nitratireducens TaxID=2605748 RepID=A0A5M6DC55_9BACT|nr:hypothetical protein [Roseiconus nitratireducens]KAA5545127.1 hypothetical protein FYK55_05440 [Roseiconus nitratireducens]